jgi:2-keto-4-pentenoate hydratase/2-oxohepta-3-ene-1,7-dioic acid hydratase in catechol pathway
VVTGIDFSNRLLTTRVNGNVLQQQYTSDLLFDVPAIVSFISQWVTLEQGDLIYTGTPGSTSKLNPGDTVEVEIDGIGVLRNPVE